MLINKIKDHRMQAMKNQDKDLVSILTTLHAEASMIGFNDGKRLSTDEEVIKVCKKFVKSIEETIEHMKSRNQLEELEKYEQELQVVNSYIPSQLSEDELKDIIYQFTQAQENVNIGLVMKHLKQNYDGLYDGRIASQIVKLYV